MIINHMICPHCGHDFYTDAAYATCAACQTFFYACNSQTCKKPPATPVTFTIFVDPSKFSGIKFE